MLPNPLLNPDAREASHLGRALVAARRLAQRYVCSMSSAKLICLASLGLLSTLISGCSWITDFVISNTSSADLFISYKVSGKSCPEDNFTPVPARKTNTELKNRDGEWKKLSPNEYSCDANTMVVKTTLPPNTALRVARIATYIGPEHYGNEDFKVLRLELNGTEGEIHLNGLKVLKAFKPESETLYVLSY